MTIHGFGWDYFFWGEATEPNKSVQYSCQQATTLTYQKHGSYGGTNTWDVEGNENTMIVPAAYGI